MSTNKPKVQRYDDMGCPEQICRVDTMHKSEDGDYVLYEDYEALQAKCRMLESELATVKKVAYGNVELLDECEELRTALSESQANDRQAMHYLKQVREIVGGDDFPEMVERCRKLVK